MQPNSVIVSDSQIPQEWNNPSDIQKIADYLAACETIEMLSELRECDIPASVFKEAALSLQPTKRKQIKSWVLVLNSKA